MAALAAITELPVLKCPHLCLGRTTTMTVDSSLFQGHPPIETNSHRIDLLDDVSRLSHDTKTVTQTRSLSMAMMQSTSGKRGRPLSSSRGMDTIGQADGPLTSGESHESRSLAPTQPINPSTV